MLVPLKWLSEYVDLRLPPSELAHRLSMAGAEVERIISSGEGWDQVVLGRVERVDPHPNADRLRLATVSYGGAEPLQVVCGAPNLAAGQTVAFAQVGAELLDPSTREPRKLKRGKIRGVVSMGMVCSERELGLSDEHEGILVLESDSPVGTPLAEVLGEITFDITPTPNRPDHFSILGIAREVAALTGVSVREPDDAYSESATDVLSRTSVEIEDAEGCPRYTAIVIDGITVGPSPEWMQRALSSVGMRPINNVVDVTNYVLMEYGQPLHAFDQARLHEGRIVVRRARVAETIGLLDGSDLELDPADLVIADADRAVALAGIMGGAEAEVRDGTTTVLLETATFDAASIRRSGIRHKLRTEASLRFEKALNPELAALAARRAAALIAETAGGDVCAGMVDAYPGQAHAPQVTVSRGRIAQILAIDPTVERVRGILSGLGIPNRWLPPDRYAVSCPPWRSDLTVDDDVVEEIGRIIGYDEMPSAALAGTVPEPEVDAERLLGERIRDVMSGLGFREAITYAAVGADELGAAIDGEPETLRIANPMSAERDRLRTSLRPGLLRVFAASHREERGPLSLFEVEKVFHPRRGSLPREERMLLALLGGDAVPTVHGGESRRLDFFDAKGVLERLGDGLGLTFETVAADGDVAGLDPSEAGQVTVGGAACGAIGRIAAGAASAFDLDGATYLIELSLPALASAAADAGVRIAAVSPYPAAVEDLAVIVDDTTASGEVRGAISAAPLVESVELFDVYTGAPVPSGRKSLAYRVVYRAPDRTLSEKDVARARRGIVRRLEGQFKAQLRDS